MIQHPQGYQRDAQKWISKGKDFMKEEFMIREAWLYLLYFSAGSQKN